MYSLSDKRPGPKLVLTVFALLMFAVAGAQSWINQTVQVLPPYTNRLSDYFNTPGRIVSVITTPRLMDTREYRFFIHGYIESANDDGDIRIGTRPDFVPSNPSIIRAQLGPDGTPVAWPPYTLTYNDFQQIFARQNLEYRGISPQQVEEQGLPEGLYRVCFTIYMDPFGDGYMEQGPFCSAPFNIIPAMTAVEPPIIIHPQNSAELTPEQMQTLVFTWTMPPGASAGTRYKLRIIEVNDPGSNYRDMLRTEAYPAYFETTVTGTPTYLYTIANPALKPGKTYAFVVRAVDPLGKVNFKNGGFSEVNTFSSPMKTTNAPPPPVTPPVTPPASGLKSEFNLVSAGTGIKVVTPSILLPATLKGTLFYQMGTKKHPLSNAKIKLVTRYVVKYSDGRFNADMTYKFNSWLNSKYENGQEIAITTTGNNGEFAFNFNAASTGDPLGDVDCYEKIADLIHPCFIDEENYVADLPWTNPGGGPFTGNDIFEMSNDDKSGCKLFRAYEIRIDGEHTRYYLDPDYGDKYFFEIKGGETKNVGEVVTKVRIIDLDVTVKAATSDYTIQRTEELMNMDVYVYRKINFNYPPIFPLDDVTPDKTDNFPAPKSNGMVCVGKAKTDKNGLARLKLLVLNDNPTYQYYLYVNNPDDYSYETGSPIQLDFKKLIDGEGQKNQDGSILLNSKNYKALLDEHSARHWENYSYGLTIKLEPKFPTLRIVLRQREGNKKLNASQPAQMTLKEKFEKGNLKWSALSYYKVLDQDETNYTPMVCCDSGTYELRDIPLEIAHSPNRVVGPKRTVTVKSPGFADTTFLVKNGDPLKIGERYEMNITLRYGASLTGKVIDRMSGKPVVNATLILTGEMSKASTTGNDGTYYLEARKLNTPRRIVIAGEGYITDTVNIRLDKDKNIYNFELFPKARLLNVEVWAGNGWLEGAVVSLPDVPESWKTGTGGTGQATQIKVPGTVNAAIPATLFNQASPAITTGTVHTAMQQLAPLLQQSQQQGSESKSNVLGKINITLSDGASFSPKGTNALDKMSIADGMNPYTELTDKEGYAGFYFKGGQGDRFRLMITNAPGSPENYPAIITEVSIPYEKSVMGSSYRFTMSPGGCISGTVYLGDGTAKPLEGIDVKAVISGQAEEYTIRVKTDASGHYELRNLPLNQPIRLMVSSGKSGSNYVGYYNDNYILTAGGSTCKTEDFHLKSVDGINLTSFLGFPFAPAGFEEMTGGRILLTGVLTLTGNKYFGTQEIEVKNAEMFKSSLTNSSGETFLIPATLPFVTDVNNITVSLQGNYKAVITDASGLRIELADQAQLKGAMTAGVQVSDSPGGGQLNGNFGGAGYTLPALWLASKPDAASSEITVYSSAGTVSAPVSGTDRFYITDGKNQSPVYSITGFTNKALVQSDKSFFDKNGLTLQTKLKADIANLNPSSVEIDAGTISISKQGLKSVNPKPFSVKLGKWSLSCNKWLLTDDGLTVSDALLSTGVDINIENLRFTSDALVTSFATVHLDKMKLLGVKEVVISTTSKGLTYKYLHDGVWGWSLYAVPDYGQSVVASLQGMPGLAPSDRIEFTAVDFNSEDESTLVLNSRKFRLFNLVDFTPYPSTRMYVTTNSLKLKGTYDFGIPEYLRPSGAMAYIRQGNTIAFDMMDMDVVNFTHNNVRYHLDNDYKLTNDLFTVKGTVEEPGHLPRLKVTMTHRSNETRIDIDKGQSLATGPGKELANLNGGIKVVSKAWDVLRFEGDLKGFNNINPGQKMNFEVRGEVKATGQQISVSDIPSFPGLSITYDMPNARFLGSAELNMNLAGMKLNGNVNTVMDSQGWIFTASGLVEIPGLGGANLFGLFGNYQNMPAEVSSKIGDAVCLPAGFKTNLNGFFISAGLTKQILPRVHYDYGIVAVDAGVDVSVNARTFMKFGQGTTFGMGVLAEGHAYLGGSCPATCTSANADAKLQFGVSGDYNTKTNVFNIDGCASVNLVISASQCLPVLVDCGPCVSVDLADFTIGAKVHLDNVKGFSMGITTSSCDQQCR